MAKYITTEYLSREEAAEKIGCHPAHIYYLVKHGHIKAHKFGNKPMQILESSVDKFLNEPREVNA